MKPDSDKVIEKAASQMTEFTRKMQMAQLRLKCAEIVFAFGSQMNKTDLEETAERIFKFSIDKTDLKV